MEMDAAILNYRNKKRSMPRLRKNPRIDNQWGRKYHGAVKNTIFNIQSSPYTPAELPPSLSGICEKLESVYICKYCNDCFRFKSSFEDHSTRRSWILGFWCQHCFVNVCKHVEMGHSPCKACMRLEYDVKRAYFTANGFEFHKMGAIRIFYNQCQFIAHLQFHHLGSVDIADIMLMPLPNTDSEWSVDLHKACEALLEHAFLSRVHIMDWLKAEKVDHNWWQLATNDVNNSNNLITKIIKNYRERKLCTLEKTSWSKKNLKASKVETVEFNVENNEEKDKKSKDDTITSTTTSINQDQDITEDEDNPCTLTDIAFVDCGPTADYYAYYPMENKNDQIKNKLRFKSFQSTTDNDKAHNKWKKFQIESDDEVTSVSSLSHFDTCTLSKDNLHSLNKNIIGTQLHHNFSLESNDINLSIATMQLQNAIAIANDSKSTNLINLHNEHLLPSLQSNNLLQQNILKEDRSSVINSNQKILTVHCKKNLNFSTIIKNISPHLLSNNKIVFLGQDSYGIIIDDNKEVQSNKTTTNSIPDSNLKQKEELIITQLDDCSNIEFNDKDIKHLQKFQIISKEIDFSEMPVEDKSIYKNKEIFVNKRTVNNIKTFSHESIILGMSMDTQKALYNIHDHSIVKTANLIKSENMISMIQPNSSQTTNISPPTPSPSPSELSSSSSCDAHNKQTFESAVHTQLKNSLHSEHVKSADDFIDTNISSEVLSFYKKNTELYLSTKSSKRNAKQINLATSITLSKCRQDMIDEFQKLSHTDLRNRILHLQHVNTELLQVMCFANIKDINTTLKSIRILQRALKSALELRDNDFEILRDSPQDFDGLSDAWELKLQSAENKLKCCVCNKIMKPKTYIPGFSKPMTDDSIYCLCYKYFCHECGNYQGNMIRFLIHQNFHKKEAPYTCPGCLCRFPSFKLLEVHTWSVCFHTLKRRTFCCKICQIDGFQDMESITRHFALMHGIKKIACEVCSVVLNAYSEYKRHRVEMHTSELNFKPIKLIMCKLGQCIIQWEKYMMHLEKYHGIRKIEWVKCPFCSYYSLETKQSMMEFIIHFQSTHLYRLTEIIKPEILKDVLPSNLATRLFKDNSFEQCENVTKFINTCENFCSDGILLPKIVNTRTIPNEVFEQDSKSIEEFTNTTNPILTETILKDGSDCHFLSLNLDAVAPTQIVNIEPNISDTSIPCQITNVDTLPKILDVRSIANFTSMDFQTLFTNANTEIEIKNNEMQSKSMDKITKQLESVIQDQLKKTCKMKFHETNTESNRNLSENYENNMKNVEKVIKQHLKLPMLENCFSEPKETPNTTVTFVPTNLCKLPSNSTPKLLQMLLMSEKNNITNHEVYKSACQNIESFYRNDSKQTTLISNCSQKMNNNTVIGHQTSTLQPPPLIKIPPNFFKSRKKEISINKTMKNLITQSSENNEMKRKRTWRIALNGPNISQDRQHNFLCHLCGELINTSWPVVSKHFKTKHSDEYKLSIVTPRLMRLPLNFINGGYKEFYNKKRKLDNPFLTSKKRRRWTPKKYTDGKHYNSLELGLFVQQETAEDEDGSFKCKKCNERCANMVDLRKHIASNHRIKGRYLICLECGENFIVAPSLQMHLKAFHGIDDPITYMNQNTSYAPDISDSYEIETKSLINNQCHVCTAVFENKAAVDKHLRVHGMAFLNRKMIEARNALRNSEKSVKCNESKQSPKRDSPKEPVKRNNPASTILEKINATILEDTQ